MEKQHIDILIATPGHSLTMPYFNSLLSTISKLAEKDISWAFVNGYSSNVAYAREHTISGPVVANASQTEILDGTVSYNKIIWIDSDIAWNPEDFIKLYESDKDIISGAYLLATGEVPAYEKILGSAMQFEQVKNMTEPIQVAATGFGFIAIKSGIFEKMTRPWFQATEVTEVRDGTEYKYNILGEDLAWCYRAKDLGYEIWLDPTIKVGHQKTMMLTWEGPRP